MPVGGMEDFHITRFVYPEANIGIFSLIRGHVKLTV